MNRNHLRESVKLAFGVAILLATGAVLVAIMRTLPGNPGQSSGSSVQALAPYPAPIDSASATITSPCDKWFSYSTTFPDEKKAIIQKQYQDCIKASKETPVSFGINSLPTDEPNKGSYKAFYRHVAGNGEIIESGSSDLPSSYLIVNQWITKDGDKTVGIFAGAQQLDLANGGKEINPPLPGVVIVEVESNKNERLMDEGGVYFTPLIDGPVRIIDANNTSLFLVSSGGNIFAFDWKDRKYTEIPTQFSISKKAGNGSLVEDSKNIGMGKGVFRKYNISNYWYQTDNKLSVFAGSEVDNTNQGVLIITPFAPNSASYKKATIYRTPFADGAVRIISVDNNNITLVSTNGLVFIFDTSNRGFVQVPPGSRDIMETFEITPESSPQDIYPTDTPRPTPSALPTSLPTSDLFPYP